MKFSVLAISVFIISNGSAIAQTQNTNELVNASEQSSQFLKQQVRSSNSVGRAIRTVLARYPENTPELVEIALDTYPDKYREIVSAAVSSQPAYIDDILELALARDLAPATELVTLAINAEPSYAEYVAEAACKLSPDQFNEIVKTAVSMAPDSADQIAKRLAKTYPNKILEVLVTTIQEVPLVGKYVVDALLALFPVDSSESESMIIISVEQLAKHPEALERLVKIAERRGIQQDLISASAMRGGLTDTQARLYVERHYIEQ
ncbi:hypothetical protein [Brumicola pallidula]|uniref:Uncharacterized protein n=1 Tax=Brumicola pallidula DSM 14239 = ACAM 615 TaxID=1121922 RepID=K6ZJJ9_9ALTE|nr:hypothetical protein [Glaciecola pallidula]GAC29058.1 hypothetical protein GPAL_2197 [Glaciecola pallidula DSM 14239 = ACAM 615]